jgi:formylglycine-generating enzyme required for sulfatase activity
MHWVLISFFRKLVDRATNTRVDSCGRTLYGHNGGIWEWTSTDFEGLPGFETSEVYPGYSTDFFDGLHKVVVSPPPLLHLPPHPFPLDKCR